VGCRPLQSLIEKFLLFFFDFTGWNWLPGSGGGWLCQGGTKYLIQQKANFTPAMGQTQQAQGQ
jgi:hypothetical protein